MSALSENAKEELAKALNDKNAAMFVVEGKLISLEMHESSVIEDNLYDLEKEIEEYPELKESLQHYLDNSGIKRYTARELKESRYDKRR